MREPAQEPPVARGDAERAGRAVGAARGARASSGPSSATVPASTTPSERVVEQKRRPGERAPTTPVSAAEARDGRASSRRRRSASPSAVPVLAAPIVRRVVESRLERVRHGVDDRGRGRAAGARAHRPARGAREPRAAGADAPAARAASDRRGRRSPTTSAAGAAHELTARDRRRQRRPAQLPRQRADRRRRAAEPGQDHGGRARHDQARRARADAVAQPLPLPDEPQPGLDGLRPARRSTATARACRRRRSRSTCTTC